VNLLTWLCSLSSHSADARCYARCYYLFIPRAKPNQQPMLEVWPTVEAPEGGAPEFTRTIRRREDEYDRWRRLLKWSGGNLKHFRFRWAARLSENELLTPSWKCALITFRGNPKSGLIITSHESWLHGNERSKQTESKQSDSFPSCLPMPLPPGRRRSEGLLCWETHPALLLLALSHGAGVLNGLHLTLMMAKKTSQSSGMLGRSNVLNWLTGRLTL